MFLYSGCMFFLSDLFPSMVVCALGAMSGS